MFQKKKMQIPSRDFYSFWFFVLYNNCDYKMTQRNSVLSNFQSRKVFLSHRSQIAMKFALKYKCKIYLHN